MNNLFNSNNISYCQKNRIKKCSYESLYLLETIFNNNLITLKMTGSTLNVYTIIISDRIIKCNCQDSMKRTYFCKHICFVICFIGKIYDENIFINYTLGYDEINSIIIRLLHNCSNDPNIVNNMLIDKYKSKILNIKDDNKSVLKRNINEDCPICYIVMNKDDPLFICHQCNNCVHMECMKIWLKNKNTCVYCREKIGDKVEGYLNISK
jgi:hypothetical protein